jgi:S1-C subfamily serine protease
MKPQATTLFLSLALALAFPLSVSGQEDDIPLLTPEEEAAVQSQTTEIFKLLGPIGQDAASSVVSIGAAAPRQNCYGAVIGDGNHVLTKWSEVVDRRKPLRVIDSAGTSRLAKIEGVYEGEDLAVLSIEGSALPVVKWSTQPQPTLGHFLVAVRPDGKAAGFGVVSVMERSLRDSNQAYLGLKGDIGYSGIGAKVVTIEPNTGAAAAGLMIGDVILKVGDRQISGLRELRNSLNDKKPGDRVAILYTRNGEESTIEILLGGRPHLEQPFNQRLKQMEQMGGEVSRVRDGFSRVIQTDMQIKPEQCGGPILDLKGNIIGLSVARSDRTRSFIISSAEISELLKHPATDPTLAKVATTQDGPMAEVDPRQQRTPPAMPPLDEKGVLRMRRNMKDMQRLMERMQQEMEGLDGMEGPEEP